MCRPQNEIFKAVAASTSSETSLWALAATGEDDPWEAMAAVHRAEGQHRAMQAGQGDRTRTAATATASLGTSLFQAVDGAEGGVGAAVSGEPGVLAHQCESLILHDLDRL
eukprot:6199076-Pleurochrysis_carterae.AAC.2